jgi:hypothetical protein
MDAAQIVATAVLKGAHAIDHRVDAADERQPVVDIGQAVEVGFDPAHGGKAAARRHDRASAAQELMAGSLKPRQDGGADEPVGSGNENTHGAPIPPAGLRGMRTGNAGSDLLARRRRHDSAAARGKEPDVATHRLAIGRPSRAPQ